MQKNLKTLIRHMLLFIGIEILFVFAVLHEFPEIRLFETLGIVHISYWILLIIAGYIRETLTRYWQKFLATYLPVLYHMIGHVYIGYVTIESVEAHNKGHEHGLLWMILATASLGVLIFVGERLLHRTTHCDHHHQSVHKHCKEEHKDDEE